MFCGKCGAKVADGDLYCRKCGAEIDHAESATPNEDVQNNGINVRGDRNNIDNRRAETIKDDHSRNTKVSISIGTAVAILIITAIFARSKGDGYEKKLVGQWYDGNYLVYTFYDDGTGQYTGLHGVGQWNIVNGDTLKYSDMYGTTRTVQILSLDGDTLKIRYADGATDELTKGR